MARMTASAMPPTIRRVLGHRLPGLRAKLVSQPEEACGTVLKRLQDRLALLGSKGERDLSFGNGLAQAG